MKNYFFILLTVVGLSTSCSNIIYDNNVASPVFTATWPCENGIADVYPCKGYDLMSYMSLDDLTPEGINNVNLAGNDSWGWTDPDTGKEYALVGLNSHTAFVDISNPSMPILVGALPTATLNSIWRDIKVYQNHAFIVSEASGHGMQVFDLTRLRDTIPPEIFTADTHFTDFGSAHNIVINEASGYAYVVGANRSGPFLEGLCLLIFKILLCQFQRGDLETEVILTMLK